MALTKLRAGQTKSGESYEPESNENLATDKEVEDRIIKHNSIYHNIRNGNTEFVFKNDEIEKIVTYDGNSNIIIREVLFNYTLNFKINYIEKTIFDINQNIISKIREEYTYNPDDSIKNIKTIII